MQSTDPDYAWAVTVMIFWLKGLFGIVGTCLSICWLLQILLYIFVYPPVTPFLNTLFTDLDNAFPLFGTVAFGIFCFYLIGKSLSTMLCNAQKLSCFHAKCWSHECDSIDLCMRTVFTSVFALNISSVHIVSSLCMLIWLSC